MSENKRIYIVNADGISSDESLDFYGRLYSTPIRVELRHAFRKHAFKGGFIDNCSNMYFLDPREATPAVMAAAATAERNGMFPVWLRAAAFMRDDVRSVCDWAAELHLHSPNVYAAVLKKKVSFQAMIDHSKRCHEAKARAAEKLKSRGLPVDEENAPTVLELDGERAGWRWVWLKTNEARDAEGTVMGHCVGDGYYDDLPDGCGVFSLRDPQGRPHVTMELDGTDIDQAQCKGNSDVTDRLQPLVDSAAMMIGLRLEVNRDPVTPLADGPHKVGMKIGGDLLWTKDGKLHREVGRRTSSTVPPDTMMRASRFAPCRPSTSTWRRPGTRTGPCIAMMGRQCSPRLAPNTMTTVH